MYILFVKKVGDLDKWKNASKGKQDSSIIYNDNPVQQAKFFENEGCKRIHIVDLDWFQI